MPSVSKEKLKRERRKYEKGQCLDVSSCHRHNDNDDNDDEQVVGFVTWPNSNTTGIHTCTYLLSLVPQAYLSLSFAESYRGSSSMKACYPDREKDERFHKTLRRLQATLPCYSTTWRLSIRSVRFSTPLPFLSPNPTFLHPSSLFLYRESIRYLSFPLRRFTYSPLIDGDSITHAFMATTRISYLHTQRYTYICTVEYMRYAILL